MEDEERKRAPAAAASAVEEETDRSQGCKRIRKEHAAPTPSPATTNAIGDGGSSSGEDSDGQPTEADVGGEVRDGSGGFEDSESDRGTDGGESDIGDGSGGDVGGGVVRPAKYLPDQRVYAMDGEGIYESVVLKARLKSSPISGGGDVSHTWSYYVHYLGWSSRWDRWIDEPDLHDDTEETRKWAESVKAELIKADEERRARAKERKEKQARAKEARKVARRQEKDASRLAMEDCCTLPFSLKIVLVDDRERITRLGRTSSGYDDVSAIRGWRPPRLLHVLPAPITINKVLKKYLELKRRELSKKEEEGKINKEEYQEMDRKWTDFVESLSRFFDRSLPVWLLYHQERTQYLAIEGDMSLQGIPKCDLYGCEHLLRLFVRLPEIVVGAKKLLKDHSIIEFAMNVADLIVFLQKNRTACFKAKYREPQEKEWTENERMIIQKSSANEKSL